MSQRQPKESQTGTKSEPVGTKSDPTGPKSEPKARQREPTVSQIQHKINIRDKVAKSTVFWSSAPLSFWFHFGKLFHQKSMENRCEKRYRKRDEN